MNIGMVLHTFYPPDIRVDKEMRMLSEAGHRLFLLCRGREQVGDEHREDGITVRYLCFPKNFAFRALNSARFYLTFRSLFWERECARFVRDFQLNALHVHDLPLVGSTYAVAKRFGLPVVADLHENYPEALQVWYGSSLRKATLNSKERWLRYEKDICLRVSRVLVVVEESKEYLIKRGIPASKILVIPNVTSPEFAQMPLDQRILGRYRDHFIISYIGGFGPHRGIDIAIRAMRPLKALVPSARLLLVGSGQEGYVKELYQLVEKMGVQDTVEFTGWRPFAEVPSYIQASDVCLVPHNPSEQTDASAPHKLFQYWMLGKPVIVSSCRSLQRIVSLAQGGLVFEAGNPQSLAQTIARLHENPSLRHVLGENGRQMVLSGEYSWQQTAARLNALYRELERERIS